MDVRLSRLTIGSETFAISAIRDATGRHRIDELKRAEAVWRETLESKKRYRRIAETTIEGVWLLDSEPHTSYVNRQMEEMLGYEPGEMVGQSVFDFYLPEDFENKQQVLKRRQQGVREQIEERLRRKDDIGQRLALLAVELQQLQEDPVILPEVRRRMGEFQKQTSEIAADVQSLSHELHSAKLQYLGIAAAMRGFCREFGEQQKVEIDVKTHDLPAPVSADISLCLFRVLQEALHNAVKHSGVRHFELRLWGTSEEIHLTVRDSGAGFDRETAKESRGLGLISMEERLKLLNGTLTIESQTKAGTTIHARVPLGSGSDFMRAAG